jgi:hypothetical protein
LNITTFLLRPCLFPPFVSAQGSGRDGWEDQTVKDEYLVLPSSIVCQNHSSLTPEILIHVELPFLYIHDDQNQPYRPRSFGPTEGDSLSPEQKNKSGCNITSQKAQKQRRIGIRIVELSIRKKEDIIEHLH